MDKSTSQKQYSSGMALQLGGVAPNIIRELSGIYPTFVSAFKELVSNAYDADATLVTIGLSPDLNTITVEDDGVGMTPFELQTEYVRIGGSVQRRDGDLTSGGRLPLGRKGIGFLAVARYCHQVEIYTHTDKAATFCDDVLLSSRTKSRRISFFQKPFARAMAPCTTVRSVRCGAAELGPNQYEQNGLSIEFTTRSWKKFQGKRLTVQYTVDCRGIDVQAIIDYDYLLNLKDDQNLETLQDFCHVHLVPCVDSTQPHFTRVTLRLNESVRRELQSSKRRGGVRNIASASGLDRFLWHLSRSIPISYSLSPQELKHCGLESLAAPISPTPFAVKMNGVDGTTHELRRPFLEAVKTVSSDTGLEQSVLVQQAIHLESDSLTANGYVLGFSQPIFPAELRGIAIRVRGVEIGRQDLLGAENDLPSKYHPFLNQMMGEVIVTEGLDAISAIMPGREGFYGENVQFQALRRHLVGDGAAELGILGKVLDTLWERHSVESSAARIVQEAKQRRAAFLDISQALTGLSVGSRYGRALRRLFTRSDIIANGLSHVPEYQAQVPSSVGNYSLELSDIEGKDCDLDTEHKIMRINRNADMWNSALYILGRDFQISLRNGKSDDPLCEIDFATGTIYINWMHPTRGKMGDSMFVKSAVFWRIAYLAAKSDVDLMMDMAHHLLSFTTA